MELTLGAPDLEEVLRYMGCPPDRAGEALRRQAAAAWEELRRAARPRWTWRVFPLEATPAGLTLGGILLPGEDIARHLAGCHRGAVFALTLSAGVDALLRRAQVADLSLALALEGCAAAAVEQLCDRAEGEIRGTFPGCFFPYRYSPGYGDLPLSLQGELLALLDAPRQVGLTASASHILTPRKSVTAILGISRERVEPARRSCLTCPGRESCQYRKSGGHCGIS